MNVDSTKVGLRAEATDGNEDDINICRAASSSNRAKMLAMERTAIEQVVDVKEELRKQKWTSRLAAFESGNSFGSARLALPNSEAITSSSVATTKVVAPQAKQRGSETTAGMDDEDEALFRAQSSFSRAKFQAIDRAATATKKLESMQRTTTWKRQGGGYRKVTKLTSVDGPAPKKSLADLP